MTGAFVRIKRDGEWDNVEINQLTDEELELFSALHVNDGWKWAKFLAKWIRDNEADYGKESIEWDLQDFGEIKSPFSSDSSEEPEAIREESSK